MLTAADLPPLIQGGMGAAVSSWRLARAVSQRGQLGVVSGVALDVVLSRRLQDGDPNAYRAVAAFPEQAIAERAIKRLWHEEGRRPGQPYTPLAHLSLKPSRWSQEMVVLGSFAEVWLAKEGHDGVVGINCLEKIQVSTPATLLGAMLADVDVVLMGAGVPRDIPRLLDGLAAWKDVDLPIDVAGAEAGEFTLALSPSGLLGPRPEHLRRPVFLAIVSAHVLATYLARDPEIRPDGFVVEASPAGGHNAPPRRPQLDENGELVFGPRDEPDLDKIAAVGLPFWVAGGAGTPDALRDAIDHGAKGVQVGTVFALCTDSGVSDEIRGRLLDGLRDGSLHVRTDPLASPTGFPFKVAELDGTMSDPKVLDTRPKLCDLGFLRTPYLRDDGAVGYRCPAEPDHMFTRKGGDPAEMAGRACVCNGLIATVGMGQTRKDGYAERPIVTLGSDLGGAEQLLALHPSGWTANDVVDWIVA